MATNFVRAIGPREILLLSACALATAAFAAVSPYFFSGENFFVLLRNSQELLLVGLGMTFLMSMGGIDISVGVALGLSAIAVANLLTHGYSPILAAAAGPVVGAAIGVVTACIIVRAKVPAIVATLGLLGVYRAAIFLALGGDWLSGLPSGLTDIFAFHALGVPISFILIVGLYLASYLILRHSPFGPHIFSIGNSEVKARLSGISVNKVRVIAYLISGTLTGLAASVYVATYRNVETSIGSTLALDAIAAVVLGGTSILGGRASLMGTFLGILFIRLIQNGLLLIGVPSLWQSVVTGGLLLLVVVSERRFSSLRLPFVGQGK